MADVNKNYLNARIRVLETELADTKLMLSTHLLAGTKLREQVSHLESEVEKWKEAYDDAHAALGSTPSGEVKP